MGLVKLYAGRDTLDAHHIRAVLEGEGGRATTREKFSVRAG